MINNNYSLSPVLAKTSSLNIILSGFFVTGSAIYFVLVGNFNFPPTPDFIVSTINFVFDTIFSSVHLLGFFIRPATLSFVARYFACFYIFRFEFKFIRVCIKLTMSLFNTLIGKVVK